MHHPRALVARPDFGQSSRSSLYLCHLLVLWAFQGLRSLLTLIGVYFLIIGRRTSKIQAKCFKLTMSLFLICYLEAHAQPFSWATSLEGLKALTINIHQTANFGSAFNEFGLLTPFPSGDRTNGYHAKTMATMAFVWIYKKK